MRRVDVGLFPDSVTRPHSRGAGLSRPRFFCVLPRSNESRLGYDTDWHDGFLRGCGDCAHIAAANRECEGIPASGKRRFFLADQLAYAYDWDYRILCDFAGGSAGALIYRHRLGHSAVAHARLLAQTLCGRQPPDIVDPRNGAIASAVHARDRGFPRLWYK